MYKLEIELNTGCYQVLYLDNKKLDQNINISKLSNDLMQDLHGINYKLDKIDRK